MIGDAFGAPVERMSYQEIQKKFGLRGSRIFRGQELMIPLLGTNS
jgi:ADP-ribosylglycohydrolase